MRAYLFTICLAVTLPASVFAYTSPGKPIGLLNDFAKVLSTTDNISIGEKLIQINKSTGTQVAVVTVNSLGDETIDSYAVKLFKEWGIGQSKSAAVGQKDNGLLILVAPNEHKARIEVGYGLEGTVTDLQAGNIVNKVMIPAFRNGDYAGGISDALDAVNGLIVADPSVVSAYSGSSSSTNNNDQQSGGFYVSLIFFAVVILNTLARILGRTKSWWLGGALGATIGIVICFFFGIFYIGFISIVVLTIAGLIFDYIVSNHPPKAGGGMWPIFFGGFGGGRGGSGGGFGGFGGGGSGGGGASGGW